MAKKKTQARRVPRAADQRMYGDGKPSQQTTAAAGAAAPAGSAAGPSQGSVRNADLAAEYSYVPKDLRRLAITAAAMFALMIILGFIVR